MTYWNFERLRPKVTEIEICSNNDIMQLRLNLGQENNATCCSLWFQKYGYKVLFGVRQWVRYNQMERFAMMSRKHSIESGVLFLAITYVKLWLARSSIATLYIDEFTVAEIKNSPVYPHDDNDLVMSGCLCHWHKWRWPMQSGKQHQKQLHSIHSRHCSWWHRHMSCCTISQAYAKERPEEKGKEYAMLLQKSVIKASSSLTYVIKSRCARLAIAWNLNSQNVACL